MDSGLYVIATPIGNLGDMSSRAVDILKSVSLIAAEDTRHCRKLLQHFAIDTPATAYHDHSDDRVVMRIEKLILEGAAVALVSDAGTPLISDPGYRLVRHIQSAGHRVIPIPGACAAIAALSASGLPSDRFFFEGFLPAKQGARLTRLQGLADEAATTMFYEAPHRVLDSLTAMRDTFGAQREAVLAREVTKTFETIHRAPLADLVEFVAADSNQQRGEIVILVAGSRAEQSELDTANAALLTRLAEELPAKKAAAIVAEHTGLKKNFLYDYLLSQKS